VTRRSVRIIRNNLVQKSDKKIRPRSDNILFGTPHRSSAICIKECSSPLFCRIRFPPRNKCDHFRGEISTRHKPVVNIVVEFGLWKFENLDIVGRRRHFEYHGKTSFFSISPWERIPVSREYCFRTQDLTR
jgi:hypothetical protein